MISYAAFMMNTHKSDTTGYSPFELVYGKPPIHPLNIAMNYEGYDETKDITKYAASVRGWLLTAREIALEKVNGSYDKHAPRFNANQSDALTFEPGALVLEWKPTSGKGLSTKLLRKWNGPLRVICRTSPVNYQVQKLQGKQKPHIVHVERLINYNEREEQNLIRAKDSKAENTSSHSKVVPTVGAADREG